MPVAYSTNLAQKVDATLSATLPTFNEQPTSIEDCPAPFAVFSIAYTNKGGTVSGTVQELTADITVEVVQSATTPADVRQAVLEEIIVGFAQENMVRKTLKTQAGASAQYQDLLITEIVFSTSILSELY